MTTRRRQPPPPAPFPGPLPPSPSGGGPFRAIPCRVVGQDPAPPAQPGPPGSSDEGAEVPPAQASKDPPPKAPLAGHRGSGTQRGGTHLLEVGGWVSQRKGGSGDGTLSCSPAAAVPHSLRPHRSFRFSDHRIRQFNAICISKTSCQHLLFPAALFPRAKTGEPPERPHGAGDRADAVCTGQRGVPGHRVKAELPFLTTGPPPPPGHDAKCDRIDAA